MHLIVQLSVSFNVVYYFNCFAEIIMQLSAEDSGPFRPKLPAVGSDIPPDAVKLVSLSWQEDPSKRPSFEELIKMNNDLNQRK